MLLTVDIGNSNVSCAVFEGDSVVRGWKMPTRPEQDVAAYAEAVRSELDVGKVDGVILGSVVRSMTGKLSEVCRALFGLEPMVASTQLDLGICTAWERPETAGIDRLAAATAAHRKYRAGAVVVDVGTAITVDAVSLEGVYLGGAIAPGLRLALRALSSGTNLLPDVGLEPPEHTIGMSTPECIRSGVIYGAAGLVDGLARRMLASLTESARIIGTGGDIDRIAPYSETIEEVDPYLVSRGLRVIYDRNHG